MSRLVLGWLMASSCLVSYLCVFVGEAPADVAAGRSRRFGPPAAAATFLVPNSSAVLAANDVITVSPDDRLYKRYLSLYNVPEADRPRLIQILNFAINSVSRAGDLPQLWIVPNSANSVVRLDLRDYRFYDEVLKRDLGWSTKAYEKLGEQDKYFHAKLIKVTTTISEKQFFKQRFVPDAYGGYHLESYPSTTQYSDQNAKPVRAHAPWLDPQAVGTLVNETQSQAPLMRADQFLVLITLPPFYYDLLDLGKNFNDFLGMLFADEKQINRARLEARGVVVKSGSGLDGIIPVARQNRTILRWRSLYGPLWVTHDTKQEVNDRDYMRILLNEKFDATEAIGTGRNGLQFYFLAKGNAADKPNERQDEAPIDIAIDNTNADRRVRNGRSCISCHREGLRPFRAMPQEMIKHAIDVVSPDPIKARQLRERYITNLSELVTADAQIYSNALRAVNGLPADDNADLYRRFYNQYAEALITPELAQYEVGMPVKDLMPILAAAKNDPYLLGLSKNDPLYAVKRTHWEESFQQAMILALQATSKR